MSDEKSVGRRIDGKSGKADGSLGANSEIGRKLKQYYDELISDEVPDRFAQLLSQLEREEKSKSTAEKD